MLRYANAMIKTNLYVAERQDWEHSNILQSAREDKNTATYTRLVVEAA